MIVGGKKVIVREVQQDIYHKLRGDGYSDALARIYAGRGALPSQYLEKSILRKDNLQQAALAGEIIGEHIISGNTICICADYDADGVSGLAVVARSIRAFGGKVISKCPLRTVGYGLNKYMVQEAKNEGCCALITCDNGIVSFEAVLEAKRLGLDVVITDHHMPDNRMIFPKADAIVNPWAETGENQFGSKNLCGAGVAWYVMACVKDYLEKRGWKHSFAMKSLVDILAVATVGDMVRLDDNNIKLVKLGLEKMNSNNVNPGIAALMDVSKYNEKAANTQTIGFGIGPMLNSCGRLGSAERAMTLLCTDDYDEAFMLASELKETNDARKLMQKQMSELAIDNLAMDVSSHSACIFNPEFNEGVVGLIASKVKDLTNLPSCVFTATEHGYIKGSFRSVPGVHIRDVIDLVSQLRPDIKLSGGGHAASAGAKCDPDKWDIFKETFNQAVIELAEKDAFNPTLMVDGELKESDINMRLAEDISTEVWGQGMAAPLFAGPVEITDQKILKDAHCKFTGKIGRLMVQGIFFGRAHFLPPISNLVYALDINVWNGNKSIQLLVQGIDESQEGLFA